MNSHTQQSYSAAVVEIKGGKSSSAVNPLIARGAFGRVDIALIVRRQSSTQQSSKIQSVTLAAIKTIPNATAKSKTESGAKLTRDVFAELNSLRLLNGHENVTPLLGYYGANDSSGDFGGWDWAEDSQRNSPTSLCLVFPYHPIDLHEALTYRRFNPSSKFEGSYFLHGGVIQSVMYDVISALQHLHSHCVLHRDVKPSNLYVTRNGRIQLGDFGLAKIVSAAKTEAKLDSAEENGSNVYTGNENITNGLCTLQYRPPEVLLGGTGIIQQYKDDAINGAFDIFSAGCIFAELLTLSGPIFPGQSVLDQIGRIFQVLGTPTEDNWPGVKLLPDWGKVSFETSNGTGLRERMGRLDLTSEMDVLSKMLVLDPLQRYSAKECLKNTMFGSFKDSCSSHRREVCNSLLPLEMQIMDPVFCGANGSERDPLAFAKQYAAGKAMSRRGFVTRLIGEKKVDNKTRWEFGVVIAS